MVAYHNLTVDQSAVESENYAEIREQWEVGNTWKISDLPKKLSYAAISDMTGIDKETVRRPVRKLIEQEWVVFNQKTGIHYYPSIENQIKLVKLNEWEIVHLGRLLDRLNNFEKVD